MADFKITRISQDPPREWGEGTQKTFYVKTMLEGHERPVSIGKKDPNALKVGDIVHGTIEKTQYETDKFIADKPAYGGGSGAKSTYQPRDDEAIKAQWSIGQAVTMYNGLSITDKRDKVTDADAYILKQARTFYAMIEHVKGSKAEQPVAQQSQPEQKPKGEPDPVYTDFGSEPVNLDDIPF